jgi:predicted transporter
VVSSDHTSARGSTNGTQIKIFICALLIFLGIYYTKDTNKALLDKISSIFLN